MPYSKGRKRVLEPLSYGRLIILEFTTRKKANNSISVEF